MSDLFANGELAALASQLEAMTASVVADTRIDSPNVRTVLRFINRIVQVMDQAFQDTYSVLIDIRFLTLSDLESNYIRDVRKSLALLTSRSRYRDAEEICSRLHHLTESYNETIEPIVRALAHQNEWSQIFSLLDEYEGRIINMIGAVVYSLDSALERVTKQSLPEVRSLAERQANEVHFSLQRLERLRNSILGLSGNAGLIELVSTGDRKAVAEAIVVGGIRMGDVYNVAAAGAVGPGAIANDTTFNQTWNSLPNVDVTKLAEELAQLRVALKDLGTDPEHDIAIAEVASAELAAKKGDGPSALRHLAQAGKWALGVATSIGTTVAVAAIKAAAGI